MIRPLRPADGSFARSVFVALLIATAGVAVSSLIILLCLGL